jgi:hypothetical protein
VPRRQVEEHDHARAGHHVAAPRAVGVGLVGEVAVDGGGDVDGAGVEAEGVDDELRVGERLGARGAVGHAHREHVGRAEGARREVGGHRGVDAAREADHARGEAAAGELVADELDEPALGEGGVDVERRREAVVAEGGAQDAGGARVRGLCGAGVRPPPCLRGGAPGAPPRRR